MRIWISTKLRDSFKKDYLDKLEGNLHRMNLEQQQQKLLETEKSDSQNSGINLFCREILSCCYGCFCCGACIDDEE